MDSRFQGTTHQNKGNRDRIKEIRRSKHLKYLFNEFNGVFIL